MTMKKKLFLFLILSVAISAFVFFIEKSPLISLITIGALVDSVNPCAFSVLFLTIGFLFSIEMSRLKVFKIGLFYIIGIFLTYILIGLGILEALSFFGIPRFVSKFAAVILIAVGLLNIINKFFPAFPIKLKIPEASHEKIAVLVSKTSLISAFLLGGFVALFEFPCTGGPYLMVLGLLHDNVTYLQGFIYLIYYNLLFVLPLVIILLVAANKNLLERVKVWRKEEGGGMKLVSGLVMILLGLIIFFII